MKIKHKRPPNYDKIIEHFPAVADMPGVIFTYEDILYVPSGNNIPDHLMKHEETHQRQQTEMGAEVWWQYYFENPSFRLTQEVEAYRNQYAHIKKHSNRQGRRQLLQQLAKDLSRPMYGNLVSKDEAKRLITE